MLLLRKAHLGEVSVTVWPQVLKEMCAARNIHVLERPAAQGSTSRSTSASAVTGCRLAYVPVASIKTRA